MTILIDIDNTFWGFSEAALSVLNKKNNTHYRIKDITYWDWFPDTFGKDWFKALQNDYFWDSVQPYPHAVEVIHRLIEGGHTIRFVTASKFTQQLYWKIHHFLSCFYYGEVDDTNIIIARDKSKIKGDVLIDDNIENLKNFDGATICYSQPWNEDIGDIIDYRAYDWLDVVLALGAISVSQKPWDT